GDGGLGKTLLGQQLTMATALGVPWLGRKTMEVGSLALFCEDDADEIHRRAAGIARHLDVPVTEHKLQKARFLSCVGEDNALTEIAYVQQGDGWGVDYRTTSLYGTLKDWALKRNVRLLLLDSLHDVFTGNENHRPEVRAFLRQLSALAQEIDGAV